LGAGQSVSAGSLQNTGIEVVFNVGRTDAEYTAKELGRIDPLQVKHEVKDEYLEVAKKASAILHGSLGRSERWS
jgi:hypothetical protein